MADLHFVRAAGWGLSWPGDASYYGYRWAMHLGPWMVFWGMLHDA